MEYSKTNAIESDHAVALARQESVATRDYFHETFWAWRAECSSVGIGLATPPKEGPDTPEALGDPESSTTCREKDVTEHRYTAFATWETPPKQWRSELWILELTRLVQTLQSDVAQLKEENARLMSQLNQSLFDFELASAAILFHEERSSAIAYNSGVRGLEATNCQRELAIAMGRSTKG